MNTENSIDKKVIEEIKASLLAQKKQIMTDLSDVSRKDSHESDNRSAQFPEYGDKPDENAQEISDFSTTIMAQKVLEKSLEDIDKALNRIEKGTYGICKYCGKPINAKRLQARPTAGACIACKTELQENE
jgi:DnaK suppressor protein